jgi:hypothetical protein
MSYFGPVIVNGRSLFPAGSLSQPGISFQSAPNTGLRLLGAYVQTVSGGAPIIETGPLGTFMTSTGIMAWASGADPNGGADTYLQRIAANRLGLFDGSTTAGDLRVGRIEFAPAASTFAQTATITNGPRAANPVNWAEVTYNNGASTGRIPIW